MYKGPSQHAFFIWIRLYSSSLMFVVKFSKLGRIHLNFRVFFFFWKSVFKIRILAFDRIRRSNFMSVRITYVNTEQLTVEKTYQYTNSSVFFFYL